jgi:glutathione S-transferase
VSKLTGEDKSDWFLAINPSGSLPVLTDEPRDGADAVTLTESGSILLYLTDRYDPEHKLNYPHGTREYYEVLNWVKCFVPVRWTFLTSILSGCQLVFQVASVGPMQDQAYHFVRYSYEKVPYAELRYLTETRRLYRVMDSHLAGKGQYGFLVGDKFTIADIACFTWANAAAWTGIDVDEFPAVKGWVAKIAARESVQRGLQVPAPFFLTDRAVQDPANKSFIEHIQKAGSLLLKQDLEDELRKHPAKSG